MPLLEFPADFAWPTALVVVVIASARIMLWIGGNSERLDNLEKQVDKDRERQQADLRDFATRRRETANADGKMLGDPIEARGEARGKAIEEIKKETQASRTEFRSDLENLRNIVIGSLGGGKMTPPSHSGTVRAMSPMGLSDQGERISDAECAKEWVGRRASLLQERAAGNREFEIFDPRGDHVERVFVEYADFNAAIRAGAYQHAPPPDEVKKAFQVELRDHPLSLARRPPSTEEKADDGGF